VYARPTSVFKDQKANECLSSLHVVVSAHSGVQRILRFCFVCLRLVYPMLPVSLDCFCFLCLRLVFPMLPVSLDCFCFLCLRLVFPMLPVSLDCFCFVCLRLVYPMLPVSLDCHYSLPYVASFFGL
jgi:hypothetical protein